jgi:hypothetical protein
MRFPEAPLSEAVHHPESGENPIVGLFVSAEHNIWDALHAGRIGGRNLPDLFPAVRTEENP